MVDISQYVSDTSISTSQHSKHFIILYIENPPLYSMKFAQFLVTQCYIYGSVWGTPMTEGKKGCTYTCLLNPFVVRSPVWNEQMLANLHAIITRSCRFQNHCCGKRTRRSLWNCRLNAILTHEYIFVCVGQLLVNIDSWSTNRFHYSITTEKQKLVILH